MPDEWTISAPVAVVGERVWVTNYRCRATLPVELGTVAGITFDGSARLWSYKVRLDRKTTDRHGCENMVWLYVGDDFHRPERINA